MKVCITNNMYFERSFAEVITHFEWKNVEVLEHNSARCFE